MRFALKKIVFLLILFFLICGFCVAFAQDTELPKGEVGDGIEQAWDKFHDGDFDGAMKCLEELLEKFPNNHLIEHTIGVFYLRERMWEDAMKFFQESMMHQPEKSIELWNHIYMAEILKEQGLKEKAEEHIKYIEAHELTSYQIRALAKIKMDIRIMEILNRSKKFERIIVRFPHYLLPDDKIDEMGSQLINDWEKVARFLNLSGDESIEVFIYPSERLIEKFFPPSTTIHEEDYAYGQIHTIYRGDSDYIDSLAPYGYYLLSRKFNRHGAPLWLVNGLDDAIRGTYMDVPLNSWVSELYDQEKLPDLMFLLDPQYLASMDDGIKNPTAGSFILFLKNKFHPNDFFYILTQPNLEFNFKSTIGEIQVEWLRWAKKDRSILEDREKIKTLVTAVPEFIEPPVVSMQLVDELKKAASLYESGDTEGSLKKVDSVLMREPRYGEALYLKGKILYDMSKFIDAFNIFKEAILYLPPATIAAGWTNYFLGRISKLKNDFVAARDFYSSAVRYPLPKDVLEECKMNLFNLDKFINIRPDPAAVVSENNIKGMKEFLKFFDDLLRARDWTSLLQMTAYELNSQSIDNFIKWFQDPVRYTENVVYTHELIKAELSEETAKLMVSVRITYPVSEEQNKNPGIENNSQSKKEREYIRYLLLTHLGGSWRILDYFDELDLYK